MTALTVLATAAIFILTYAGVALGRIPGLRLEPVPYLLGLAMAANVGSTATITGNPQTMIIGAISHIPYTAFAAVLAPVAVAGLVLVTAVILAVWWSEFRDPERLAAVPPPA